MGAPDRTTGLPYHLFYPVISLVLLAVASFSSADSLWYVSINTPTQAIRFGTQDYCGYNVTNLVITGKLGCVYRGWQYQIPKDYFGYAIPADVSFTLSKVIITTVVSFGLVLVSGVHHAYTIRYSFRRLPDPNKDKLYSLAHIHFISVAVSFLFTWVAFVAQAAVIGHATGSSVSSDTPVTVYWGQGPWLVLASAVVHFGWGYEATRWRVALLK